MRQEMEPAAQWIRNRLGFKMVIERCEIAPDDIAAKLDQCSADHNAKNQPAEKPDHDDGRLALRKWASIQQWTKKDGEKSGLEQLNFPPVTVPILPDVHERHVERPKRS